MGIYTVQFHIYRYIDALWQIEMSTLHAGRSARIAACSFPWINVPLWQSFLAEFAGTCFLTLASSYLSDSPFLANNDPLLFAGIFSAIITATVIAVLDTSGGMFNPLLATVLVGGCKGHAWYEHVFVYWVGAISGAVVGMKLYPTLSKTVNPNKKVPRKPKTAKVN